MHTPPDRQENGIQSPYFLRDHKSMRISIYQDSDRQLACTYGDTLPTAPVLLTTEIDSETLQVIQTSSLSRVRDTLSLIIHRQIESDLAKSSDTTQKGISTPEKV